MWRKWRKGLALPRAEGVTDTQVAIGFLARFYDEFAGGLPDVLMPTIQAHLGLSLTQVGLLRQVLDYVGAGIEPINGLLIDLWQRKWLMGFGAAILGLSITVIGLVPTFAWLVAAYVLFGLSSGPLAHTGDVVIVEAYPTAPDRAYARSTFIDTVGALLAPLLVAFFIWQGWRWPWLLIGAGGLGLLYAGAILKTGLPQPKQAESATEQHLLTSMRQNLRVVLQDREAVRRLTLLFAFRVLELTTILKTVWLAQVVGMSQGVIGIYVAAEMGVGLISLVVLDLWRRRASTGRILRIATLAVAGLYPLWLLTPGLWPRFGLMVPLVFFFSMFWPILKSSALSSLPGRAGAVTAINALFGLVPLPLLYGLLADGVGLTSAMLIVHLSAILVIGGLVFFSRQPATT